MYFLPLEKKVFYSTFLLSPPCQLSLTLGPTGIVYAVEFSHRSGRDLINMAKTRPNIIPIIEDARHPLKYRMLVGMVDCVFADVAQPDQARIIMLNAHYFLKVGGGIVISIKANCIDSTVAAEKVFVVERQKLVEEDLKLKEQVRAAARAARAERKESGSRLAHPFSHTQRPTHFLSWCADHAGALRARPRRRDWHLPRGQGAEQKVKKGANIFSILTPQKMRIASGTGGGRARARAGASGRQARGSKNYLSSANSLGAVCG